MSTWHPTFTDKDRPAPLIEDGEWHPIPIAVEDLGGALRDAVTVPDGTYLLLAQLHAETIQDPDSGIEFRIQRHPSLDSTAWTWPVDVRRARCVEGGLWSFGWSGKITAGTSQLSTIGAAHGIEYRVLGGRIRIIHRILKFLRQADEPLIPTSVLLATARDG